MITIDFISSRKFLYLNFSYNISHSLFDCTANLTPDDFKKYTKTPILIDGRRIYDYNVFNDPLPNEVFRTTPPDYNILIEESSGLESIWFTFDGGLNNITITELTGTINNSLWEQIPEGQVTL